VTPKEKAPARIAVLGAGSWGTALAIQWARAGVGGVRLWGRDAAHRAALQAGRVNQRYLPEAPFPDTLQVADDLQSALDGVADVLVAVPSHGLRELLTEIRPQLGTGQRLCWATKGFEIATGKLPHEVAREVLGSDRPTAVLSGPTFAREVGAGLPTAMTIASQDGDYAAQLARDVSTPTFRAYTSTDIVGVEVGGAVKNVLAIGAGLCDGQGFGANTRIALITRGLMDMVRLGEALGARRETFMGLAGLGDLVLTCTDDQSRNRRFGLLLAQGLNADDALARIGQVVEGYLAARVVSSVAARAGVPLPVCEGIHDVLYEGKPASQVVAGMMERPIEAEFS
jgi:glycerol-3-phosphate dehydrogenase (NAD(P)+)